PASWRGAAAGTTTTTTSSRRKRTAVAGNIVTGSNRPRRSALMILGLRTCVVYVRTEQLDAAKAWYASAVGVAPYFDTPYYVGFNVGGFELGLHPEGEPGA